MKRNIFILLTIASLMMISNYLLSYSSGKTGSSENGCTCHGTPGSGTSTIEITSNPDLFAINEYEASTTYSLTISVQNGPESTKGGFNLKVSDGTLTNPGTNAKVVGSEATHSNSNSREWTVDWTAPGGSTSMVNFYYAGNAVNGNFSTTGDEPTAIMTKSLSATSTFVSADNNTEIKNFNLYQNHPNPFNNETNINYSINNAGKVELTIFNMLGIPVFNTLQNHNNPGNYTFKWYGRDNKGNTVATGTYIYQLKSNNQILNKKLILMK